MKEIYVVTYVCHGDSASGKGTALKAFKTEKEATQYAIDELKELAEEAEKIGVNDMRLDIDDLSLWIDENGYEYSVDKIEVCE